MLEYLVWPGLVLLGAAVGVYGTLVGAGGGFILVPVLLILYPDLAPEVITAISLGVVTFNGISGSIAYGHQKRIDFKAAGLFAASTVPGAITGAMLTGTLPRDIFQTAFAALLCAVAIFLVVPHPNRIVTTPPPKRFIRRLVTDYHGLSFRYPDGFVFPTAELRGQIVRLFRQYKPDVVLTWDGFRTSFNHIDHRNIGIAVRDAVYPAVRDHLYYPEHMGEGLDEHRVNELLLAGSDKPDYFVDISAFIEKKVDAMLSHRSQVSTHDRDEMLKNMRERAHRTGRRGMYESFKRVRIGRNRPPPEQAEATGQTAPTGAGSSRA